jgi:hypothetical protein
VQVFWTKKKKKKKNRMKKLLPVPTERGNSIINLFIVSTCLLFESELGANGNPIAKKN